MCIMWIFSIRADCLIILVSSSLWVCCLTCQLNYIYRVSSVMYWVCYDVPLLLPVISTYWVSSVPTACHQYLLRVASTYWGSSVLTAGHLYRVWRTSEPLWEEESIHPGNLCPQIISDNRPRPEIQHYDTRSYIHHIQYNIYHLFKTIIKV